jgi:hypothetical protein
MRAWVESAFPLKGTCSSFTPAFAATSSMSRCGEVPCRSSERDLAGVARACAMKSSNVLIGESAFTTRPKVYPR